MWSRDWRVSETCLKSVSEVCRRCAVHLDRHVEDGASQKNASVRPPREAVQLRFRLPRQSEYDAVAPHRLGRAAERSQWHASMGTVLAFVGNETLACVQGKRHHDTGLWTCVAAMAWCAFMLVEPLTTAHMGKFEDPPIRYPSATPYLLFTVCLFAASLAVWRSVH